MQTSLPYDCYPMTAWLCNHLAGDGPRVALTSSRRFGYFFAMAKIADLWEHHDWSSAEYAQRWAEGQDPKEAEREEPFRLMTEVIPYPKDAPITLLDLGSGPGALSKFLLGHFTKATVVCHDGSDEMIKLGQTRMAEIKDRVRHVQADFSHRGWSQKIDGSFEAVVS